MVWLIDAKTVEITVQGLTDVSLWGLIIPVTNHHGLLTWIKRPVKQNDSHTAGVHSHYDLLENPGR